MIPAARGRLAGNLDKEELELKKKVALRIKELRKMSGKKQTEFAYDLGIDKQSLYRLENGKGATIYTIYKICKATGVSLSQFFDFEIKLTYREAK